MKLPINYLQVNEFERQNNLFNLTREYSIKWWKLLTTIVQKNLRNNITQI